MNLGPVSVDRSGTERYPAPAAVRARGAAWLGPGTGRVWSKTAAGFGGKLVAVAMLLMLTVRGACVAYAAPEESEGEERTIRFSFVVSNDGSEQLKEAAFWTYAPVERTAHQRLTRLEVSLPYETRRDHRGNLLLGFAWEALPPHAVVVVHVTAALRMSDEPLAEPAREPDAFLAPEPLIEVDHPRIRARALELAADTPANTARRIFDWVAAHVRYDGYARQDRGALYALDRGTGDCSELAHLFTALARANGIPARVVGGYAYVQDAVLRPADYHAWAEFFSNGRWRLADPQRRVFDAEAGSYIAMRIYGPAAGGVPGPFHRYALVGEGLSARMR